MVREDSFHPFGNYDTYYWQFRVLDSYPATRADGVIDADTRVDFRVLNGPYCCDKLNPLEFDPLDGTVFPTT
jgi:hypothetical protein